MDPQTIRSFLDIGIAGLLMVALIGGFRGWYVWKWQWDRLSADRDEWKALAMRSLDTTERAADLAERSVKASTPDRP
jgi:hypothetical protein